VVAAIVQRFQELHIDCLVLSNGNVGCCADVNANLAATGAHGLMVAEQLLRDPALFALPTAAAGQLAGGFDKVGHCAGMTMALEYVKCLERAAGHRHGARRCRLEDGANHGGNYGRRAPRSVVKEDEEFERYSVWWTNYECVSHHLRHMFEPESPLVSEIKTVHSVKATLRILRHWTLLKQDTNRDKTR